MITVKRYRATHQKDWNEFISHSANGTFILDRRFMDYHKDRFVDHSILLYEGGHKLIAVFPANEVRGSIYSHGGLTYGGLIVGPKMKLLTTLSCFYAVTKYYHANRCTHISYKPVPSFFHISPYYHDAYALFLLHARISTMNTGFILDLYAKSTISKHHVRLIKKARRNIVDVVKMPNGNEFWNQILIPHLAERFGAKPVHTLTEINVLQKQFPKNILQYIAEINGKLTAGSTIFLDRGVAHSQYIANNQLGRETGSVDYLFWYLIAHEFKHLRFFSFGSTNMGSPDGRSLSRGLVEWKEKFGATMFPLPCYDIQTKNYRLLEAYK